MALEVELKAHIADPRRLQVTLEGLEGISEATAIDKQDCYIGPDADTFVVRLRSENDTLAITHKKRTIADGVETNQEIEFSTELRQKGAVLDLFAVLGYTEQLTKRKTGLRYTLEAVDELGPLTIEVCEVSPLGWFLEMEYLVDDPSLVEKARRALLQTLSLVEIDRSLVESRPYMNLLKEQGSEVRPQHQGSEQRP
ncbi:MAG: CYTH domain-containing protein [Sphaerochaeta sp.]|jgi:adenylate cyclase class 2|nr:CYTH domain-containing protein [Spirochaetales bacterium]